MRNKPVFGVLSYVLWIGVSIVILFAAIVVSSQVLDEERLSYTYITFAFAFACVAVPITYDLAFRSIHQWISGMHSFLCCAGDDPAVLFRKDLSFFCSYRNMHIFGVCFAFLATIIVYIVIPVSNDDAKMVQLVTVFAGEYLAGQALLAFIGLGYAIHRIGYYDDCDLRVSRDNFGVLSTGTMMFKIWCAALFLWTIYQIPLVVDLVKDGNKSLIQLIMSPITLILTFSTLVIIVISFYWCQLPLHNKMVEIKKNKVIQLDRILAELSLKAAENVSDELIRKVQFFETRLSKEQSLPEWPATAVTLSGTVILSVVSTLLPSMWLPPIKVIINGIFGLEINN